MKVLLIVVLLGLFAVGCGVGSHTRASGAVTVFPIRSVQWNPLRAPVGVVRAVTDAGNLVVVFGDSGTTIFAAGALAARDVAIRDWVDAATLRGPEGADSRIVAIDAKGRLYSLHGGTSFEDVSARYGLDGARILGAATLDEGRIAFLLDRELAVADGTRIARYALKEDSPWRGLAGGGGFGAGISSKELTLFDASTMGRRTYGLAGVVAATLGSDGRLYAATRRAIYAVGPNGDLELVYDADRDSLHGLVASGHRVWFADGSELGVVEGNSVAETMHAGIAPDAKLFGSASGDVWVLSRGELQRLEPDDKGVSTWADTFAPIFARSCAACHSPGGPADVDLSSPERWQAERASIQEQVITRRRMPPAGHPLSDVDRSAIRAWSESVPAAK